jgi:hypothetical protein
MAKINGIEASAIAGLGQIGVGGSSPTPTVYPTGGLIANSGAPNPNTYDGTNGSIWGVNGASGSMPSWFVTPNFGTGASSASVWTKIVGNSSTIYCLSSSGELYSAGTTYTYTGRTSVGFVNGRLDKVTLVTPTSSWTDITMGQLFAVGINNGYIWGTGAPSNGEFGSGSAAYSDFGTWRQLSTNQGWVRVEGGQTHTLFMSGSTKASGSVWISGNNGSGRTGMNTTSGNTVNRAEPFGKTGSIWTDMSAGTVNTYLVSGGQFFGTGLNSGYQLGDGSTTQRTSFGNAISVAGFTVDKVFSGVSFGKVITTESFMCHTGNQNYSRGDGSTAQITAWTRLHTASAEFSASWSAFYWQEYQNNYYGMIGINRNRPYYLQAGSNNYTAVFPVSTQPYQSASYLRGAANTTTWVPFFSGSFANNLNVTASAVGYTNYNADVSNGLFSLWMYLTPQ